MIRAPLPINFIAVGIFFKYLIKSLSVVMSSFDVNDILLLLCVAAVTVVVAVVLLVVLKISNTRAITQYTHRPSLKINNYHANHAMKKRKKKKINHK